jgi:hypothetical protein
VVERHGKFPLQLDGNGIGGKPKRLDDIPGDGDGNIGHSRFTWIDNGWEGDPINLVVSGGRRDLLQVVAYLPTYREGRWPEIEGLLLDEVSDALNEKGIIHFIEDLLQEMRKRDY